jgi:microcystin-dependent protein
MTPVMPEDEPTVCRLYSIPASLLGTWDGAVGLLCSPHLWTRGDDIGAVSVSDVNAAYAAIIEKSWERGCRMVGEIIELGTDTVPDWALLCDGTEYANADYPELAAVISAGLVTDGTHFRTPDRINRFGMYGPPTGVQGGENTHVLTVTEMPSHHHTYTATTLPEASAVLGVLEGFQPGPQTLDTGDTGGDAGHNNLPQYEGTIFVIVAMSQ